MNFKKSSWDSESLSCHYEYFIIRKRIRQDNHAAIVMIVTKAMTTNDDIVSKH